MKKRVYITELHHHVIKEWFRYKEQGVHLLSFDYHTDFFRAFVRKGGDPLKLYEYSPNLHNTYLNKHVPCYDIDAAIKDLRHDEYIDFALRSGIIEKAYVFSYYDFPEEERVINVWKEGEHRENAKIFSYCERYSPFAQLMAKNYATDEVLKDVIEAFHKYGFHSDNYILDFDCDFIQDQEAMAHSNLNELRKLIKGAKAITIALEPKCVDEFSNHTLSAKQIEKWLVGLIKECCGIGNVEINYENDETSTGKSVVN